MFFANAVLLINIQKSLINLQKWNMLFLLGSLLSEVGRILGWPHDFCPLVLFPWLYKLIWQQNFCRCNSGYYLVHLKKERLSGWARGILHAFSMLFSLTGYRKEHLRNSNNKRNLTWWMFSLAEIKKNTRQGSNSGL